MQAIRPNKTQKSPNDDDRLTPAEIVKKISDDLGHTDITRTRRPLEDSDKAMPPIVRIN